MHESKKMVIKVHTHDKCSQRKALKAVSRLLGIDSLVVDKDKNLLTIIGAVDPIKVVEKLKKWKPNLVTVGPAKVEKKEPEKIGPPKKEPEKNKENEDDEKNRKQKQEEEAFIRRMILEEACRCRGHNPYPPQCFCIHPVEEYPTPSCVIC